MDIEGIPRPIPRSYLQEDPLAAFGISTFEMATNAGAIISASETAASFFRSFPGGSVWYFQGEEAISETEVSSGFFEFTLPDNYVAGGDIKIRAVCKITGSGTLGTCTIDFECRVVDNDGAGGSDICATAAQAVTGTAAAKDFTITATGLTAGTRLACLMTSSIQETAGSAIRIIIPKLQMLCDVQG